MWRMFRYQGTTVLHPDPWQLHSAPFCSVLFCSEQRGNRGRTGLVWLWAAAYFVSPFFYIKSCSNCAACRRQTSTHSQITHCVCVCVCVCVCGDRLASSWLFLLHSYLPVHVWPVLCLCHCETVCACECVSVCASVCVCRQDTHKVAYTHTHTHSSCVALVCWMLFEGKINGALVWCVLRSSLGCSGLTGRVWVCVCECLCVWGCGYSKFLQKKNDCSLRVLPAIKAGTDCWWCWTIQNDLSLVSHCKDTH